MGGSGLLEHEYKANQLVKRSPGKPVNTKNANAVKRLKAEGLSQAEIVRHLGLSSSTVHRYWRK